ncbi:MAG: ankyrin repeat domain-containing protein [Planctomycetota bacterium]
MDGQMLVEAIALEDAGEALEIVRGLLGSGVDVNATDFEGTNALARAVWNERWAIAELLIDRGAERPSGSPYEDDPLFGIAVAGPLDLLDRALDHWGGWGCMVIDRQGEPCIVENPIARLICAGDSDRLDALWRRGVSELINLPSYDEGNTPLMESVRDGDLASVHLLLDKGADANSYMEICDSYTALDRAVSNLDSEMVRLLLDAGANPNFSHGYKLPLRDVRLSPFDAGQTKEKIAKGRQIYELMLEKATDFPPPVGQDGKPIEPWPPKR